MYPPAGRSGVYSPTTVQPGGRVPVSGSYRMMDNGSDAMVANKMPRGQGGPPSSVYEVNYEISV